MKKVVVSVPSIDELLIVEPDKLQDKMVEEVEAKNGIVDGVAVILNESSISVAPDRKSAVYQFYVILGDEEAVKNAYKLYYPGLK